MRTERFRRILEAAGSADPKWFASKKTTYRKVRVSVCWFRKTIEPALFLHFQRKNEGVSPEGGTNDA